GGLRLGHTRLQRFPRMPSARARYPRSDQPGVQGLRRQRPQRRETFGQPRQGDGCARPDRKVPAGVWAGWVGGAEGGGVTGSLCQEGAALHSLSPCAFAWGEGGVRGSAFPRFAASLFVATLQPLTPPSPRARARGEGAI